MTIHGTNKWGGDASALQARSRPQARWSRSPNVLHRPTRQGVMVLPAEGAAVMLSGVAVQVWEALARPVADDQLAERLAPPGADAHPAPDEVAAALRRLQVIGAVREIQ